jgi:SAM-dependent methyltransferase
MSNSLKFKHQISCPISGSSNVKKIETFKTSDIAKLYQRDLSINVHSEFNGYQNLELLHCSDSDLKFFYPLVSGSESFYEQLQDFDWYYLEKKYEYEYAKKFINASDNVLEIGCGRGLFSKILSTKNYLGLEFSEKAKLDATQNNIKVLNESIQDHSMSYHEKYNIVCSFQVLEHVADISLFIESSLACLKPGGLLIYSVPSANSFLSVDKNHILNMPPHHISWWSDNALIYLSERFNLELIEIKHEPLAEIHKKSYLSCIFLESFNQRLKLDFSLLNLSFSYRFFSKLSSLFAAFFVNGMNTPEILPDGHSVIAIYRKPKS